MRNPASSAEVERLVDDQIAQITQPELLSLIRSLRIPARCELRPWDYGRRGEAYPCWIVLEHRASNTAVAYCVHEFGPRDSWGLLFIDGPHMSMGMDSGWFTTLEDAVRESMAWEGNNRRATRCDDVGQRSSASTSHRITSPLHSTKSSVPLDDRWIRSLRIVAISAPLLSSK